MIKVLIFFLASVSLTSCGVKKTGAPELGDLSYSTYSSCQQNASQRQSPVAGGVVDSGYFGKLIDRSSVNAILDADVMQTAARASYDQLSMYVVNQGSCSTFSFLPLPPSNVFEYWREASGGSGVGSLLGLYKEDCQENCKPDQVINPLVMLNACTDRWTMVHEILHHNFNVQRKRYKPFDSDEAIIAVLLYELNQMDQIVTAYNQSPSEYQGMQLVHSLDKVRDLLIRFTYQTSFEEVSIESLLLREFANYRLRQVPTRAVKNAINYVRYSTASGIDRLAPIRKAAEDLGRSARQNGWQRVASNAQIVKSKIDTFEDDSTCYQNEAVNLYREASGAAVWPGGIEWGLSVNDERFSENVSENFKEVINHVDSHVDPRAADLTKRIHSILGTIK